MAQEIKEAIHAFLQRGKHDEDQGARPSIISQGYEKCIQYWMWKEEKIGRKRSNNNNKGTPSGGRKQAIQIEKSEKETPMEKASVCI